MTTEIILTFAVLGITIVLFVKEWLRVDVVAPLVSPALIVAIVAARVFARHAVGTAEGGAT